MRFFLGNAEARGRAGRGPRGLTSVLGAASASCSGGGAGARAPEAPAPADGGSGALGAHVEPFGLFLAPAGLPRGRFGAGAESASGAAICMVEFCQGSVSEKT